MACRPPHFRYGVVSFGLSNSKQAAGQPTYFLTENQYQAMEGVRCINGTKHSSDKRVLKCQEPRKGRVARVYLRLHDPRFHLTVYSGTGYCNCVPTMYGPSGVWPFSKGDHLTEEPETRQKLTSGALVHGMQAQRNLPRLSVQEMRTFGQVLFNMMEKLGIKSDACLAHAAKTALTNPMHKAQIGSGERKA